MGPITTDFDFNRRLDGVLDDVPVSLYTRVQRLRLLLRKLIRNGGDRLGEIDKKDRIVLLNRKW